MKPFLNEQLRRSLLLEIASGFYPEGGRFLSNRKVCRMWKVSETTAKRSFAALVADRLLEVRPRSGYRIAQGARRRALLYLHRTQAQSLPPPLTWESKRFGLRTGGRNRRRLAVVFDGIAARQQQPASLSPSVVSSSLLCARAFFEEGTRRNLEILIYLNNGARSSPAEIVDSLFRQAPDGVAVFRRGYAPSLHYMPIRELARSLPVISVFEPAPEAEIPSICINNVGTGYDAACILIRNGHRRFAFLSSRPESRFIAERFEGFEMAVRESGAGEPEPRKLYLPRRREPAGGTRRKLRALFADRTRRPTAVFSPNVAGILQLRAILAEARCRVPGDVSVIACASSILVPRKTFPYDLMDLDFAAIGHEAFALLTDLIEGRPVERTVLFDPPHRFRGSTGRFRERAGSTVPPAELTR